MKKEYEKPVVDLVAFETEEIADEVDMGEGSNTGKENPWGS